MMAKPMNTLHLHYPMIQFLIMFIYTTSTRERFKTILYHATENAVANQINTTYVRCKMESLDIPSNVACVVWRFLSNLKASRKWGSRDKERQSREEPGRETT